MQVYHNKNHCSVEGPIKRKAKLGLDRKVLLLPIEVCDRIVFFELIQNCYILNLLNPLHTG